MSLVIDDAVNTATPKHIFRLRNNRSARLPSACKMSINIVDIHLQRLCGATEALGTVQPMCSCLAQVDGSISNLKPGEHPAFARKTSVGTLAETECSAQPLNGSEHVLLTRETERSADCSTSLALLLDVCC